MVARLGWADAVSGAPSYVGRALRQLMSPLLGGATAARPLGAMSGVRPGTSAAIVSATSTTWTVTPFAGVIDLEAAAIAGPYPFAFDANVTGSVTAANASYARVDILYVRVSDPSEGDGSSVPLIEVLYLAGTAAAAPVAPTVPARSFVIANLNVPVSGGGSPTVSFKAPYVVAAGGILPGTASALAASSFSGQYLDDPTFGLMHSNGSVWEGVSGLAPVAPSTAVVGSGSVSVNALGTVSFNGASSVSLNGVFTSAFSHYRVIVAGALTTSSSAILNLRLRAAAVDASSAGYRYAGTDRFLNSASAVTSSLIGAWAGTSFNCGTFAESGYSLIVDILNPAAPVVTQMQGTSTGSSVGGGWSHTWDTEGQHSAASSYDGFSLIPASLLVSGTVTVYGYNA